MSGTPGSGSLETAQAKLDSPDVQGAFKGRTLGTALVGTVLVVVHNSLRPAPEEWARYCDLVGTHKDVFTAQVVLAEGPGPDALQRQQVLNRVPRNHAIPPTAVFTRSTMVRGVIALFNWFTPRAMRAFPPEDLPAAARHVKMTEAQLRHLVDIARALLPEEP